MLTRLWLVVMVAAVTLLHSKLVDCQDFLEDSACFVEEYASKDIKPCQIPFKFEDET